jgi:hypothetical protein
MAITRTQQARQMYKKGSMEPVKQAGVMNFMPSEMVTVPKIAKSSPDTPTAKLAYITPEEQDILIDLNLYGSLDGKPNRGPGGIPSLEGDFGSPTGSTYSGGSAGEDGGSRRGPPPGSPDYNRTATFTPSPALPPGVQKAIDEGRPTSIKTKEDEKKAKKEVQEFLKKTKQKKTLKQKFVTPTQKILYNIFPNNPKNEKAYVRYLQSQGVTIPPDLLKAIEEEDKKLSFEDFQNLVAFNPPDYSVDPITAQNLGITPDYAPMNFAEYMASQGNFGLITGGNLGNLKDFKNPGGIIDPKTGLPMTDFEFEKLKQSSSQYNPGGGGDPTRPDPCKGPNPPAYCNIDPPSDPNDPSTPSTGVFAGIAPRFAGSIFDFDALRAGAMDGGIMNNQVMGGMADGNIDEAGRQMYFLGKLVKKATRAVKKVVKSPFGKAALLGAGAYFMPGFGIKATGGFSNFMKPGGFLSKILTKGGNKALSFDNLSLGKTTALGLGIPFALDALGIGKDDDDKMDLDEYYRTQGINVADIRLNPYNYLAPRFAADGGRINYQEGGDAEPVAKKTMPLIDMDGQEKDYRETGGFVDMGRMERADDVPARLSKNEFVFTADAVRNAGEGDIDKGAEVMYNMMKNLEAGGEVSEESQGLEGAREMFKTSQRLEEVL